jgi:hypothetical protein
MAITQSQSASHIVRHDVGSFLDDAGTPAAATITLGYRPKYVAWHNVTDRISYEWFDGAADGTTLKTAAAGTRTLDTGDAAIAPTANGFTIAAAVILQNKQYRWVAR